MSTRIDSATLTSSAKWRPTQLLQAGGPGGRGCPPTAGRLSERPRETAARRPQRGPGHADECGAKAGAQ
eukprot:5096385-Pleurochrysis_carterae.AAC.1